MRKIGALCERVAFYKPRAIRHLVLTNCETHQRAEVDTAHWRHVVPSLFLSEQQVMGFKALLVQGFEGACVCVCGGG